jgi:hypothetical protein
MVYVDSSGRIHERRPIGLHTIPELFWMVVNLFVFLYVNSFFHYK